MASNFLQLFQEEKKLPAIQPKFVLIGATLPRTGTQSLMIALRILLKGKVMHMIHIFQYEDQFEKIYSGDATDVEFKQFFLQNGFIAAVDAPFCFHYKQALRAFPDAKILLTTRDPIKWSKSIKETVYNMWCVQNSFPRNIFNFKIFDQYLMSSSYMQQKFGHLSRFMEKIQKGEEISFYNDYYKEVKEVVPVERLLEYSVVEGWEPLCKFLGVPIPNLMFPHVNESNDFQAMIHLVKLRSWILLSELITLPLCIGTFYYFFKQ